MRVPMSPGIIITHGHHERFFSPYAISSRVLGAFVASLTFAPTSREGTECRVTRCFSEFVSRYQCRTGHSPSFLPPEVQIMCSGRWNGAVVTARESAR